MSNQSQLTGPTMIAAQGIYSESSTQLHGVGELMHTNDGRAFRYAKVGATALVPGQMYQAPAEDTTNFQNLTATIPVVGATAVVTTSTVTLTANQLAGGFLVFESATTNMGQIFRIQGHAAATADVVTINLDDPIVYLATGTLQIDMHPNPYNGVIVAPTTETSSPVGAALYKVTAAYFGWLQTHGVAPVFAQGTVTVGDNLVLAGTTDAGTVVAQGANSITAPVGTAITGIADGDYGLAFLTID